MRAALAIILLCGGCFGQSPTGVPSSSGPGGPGTYTGTSPVVVTGSVISLTANARTHAISVTFDGGGAALTSGVSKILAVPFGCTIAASILSVDAGTATVKTWKIASGTAIPTVANNISISGISISSGTSLPTPNASDFTTTTVTKNDIFIFNLFAVSGATQVNFILECGQ